MLMSINDLLKMDYWEGFAVQVSGLLFLMLVGSGCWCEYYKPVYLQYGELRKLIRLEPPRQVARRDQTYQYQDMLLIGVTNEGIHLFDNRSAERPIPLGFLKIPGNTEMMVKDGYLYADSYIDRVVIDLNDRENIREVSRQTDAIMYDPYAAIPDDVVLDEAVDTSKGVVVGYTSRDGFCTDPDIPE